MGFVVHSTNMMYYHTCQTHAVAKTEYFVHAVAKTDYFVFTLPTEDSQQF